MKKQIVLIAVLVLALTLPAGAQPVTIFGRNTNDLLLLPGLTNNGNANTIIDALNQAGNHALTNAAVIASGASGTNGLNGANGTNGISPVIAAGTNVTVRTEGFTNIISSDVSHGEVSSAAATAVTAAQAYTDTAIASAISGIGGPTNGVSATTVTNIFNALTVLSNLVNAAQLYQVQTNSSQIATNLYGQAINFVISYVTAQIGTNPYVLVTGGRSTNQTLVASPAISVTNLDVQHLTSNGVAFPFPSASGNYVVNTNGSATNLTVYTAGTAPPEKVVGGGYQRVVGQSTNYGAVEEWNSDPLSVYGSNILNHVSGVGYGNAFSYQYVDPLPYWSTNVGLFDRDDSYAGNNTTANSETLDNLTLYRHNFYNADLNHQLGTNTTAEGKFTASVTNVPGIGQAVLYRYDGYGGSNGLPSVLSADYVQGTLQIVTNTAPNTNATPTSPVTVAPEVINYFSTCDTIVATNIATLDLPVSQFVSPYPNVYLYSPFPYPTNQYHYTVLAQAIGTGGTPANNPGNSGFGGLYRIQLNYVYLYTVYHTLTLTNYTWSGTPPASISALNDLVFWLKATNPVVNGVTLPSTNLWNVWGNGALYPFAANTPDCNAKNLLNGTNWIISWKGFMATSPAHGSWGISNNGTAGSIGMITNVPVILSSGSSGGSLPPSINAMVAYVVAGLPATNTYLGGGISSGGFGNNWLSASQTNLTGHLNDYTLTGGNNLSAPYASHEFLSASYTAGSTNLMFTANDLSRTSTGVNWVEEGGSYRLGLGGIYDYNAGVIHPSAAGVTLGFYGLSTNTLAPNEISALSTMVRQYEAEMGR